MSDLNLEAVPPVMPESLPPVAPPRPRVWPALTIGFGVIPVNGIMSVLVVLGAAFANGIFQKNLSADEFMEWFTTFATQPLGFFIVLLPSQLVFLSAALGGAWLSPQPARERLGLGRGRLPVWSWPVLMMATPFFSVLSVLLMMAAMADEGQQLKMLGQMAGNPSGMFAVVTTLMLGLVGPVIEETLFRGYVQRRLLERWPPAVAIAVSTLMFGLAHLDPNQALVTLVLGAWLGVVAWRCASIWPAVACHATQNLLFVVAHRFGGGDESGGDETKVLLVMVAVLGVFFSVAVWLMVRYGRVRELSTTGNVDVEKAT